jgi:hypothetical protein
VQRAFERLARKHADVEVGLFLAAVRAEAWNMVREARPVELTYVRGEGSHMGRMTSFFPNQIFGCLLKDAFDVQPEGGELEGA